MPPHGNYMSFSPEYAALEAPARLTKRDDVTKPTDAAGLILESWAQGYMVGSLIIMAAITIANMRKGVLLHKLILLELFLGTFHGTFMFPNPPVYGWYLSSTAIFLNISWSIHNVVAWIKTKPFLSKKWSYFYIGTVILAQPYWVVEIYANFTYFNNINKIFLHTRPYEALFRDPWWIFSTVNLFYNIVTHYRIPLRTILVISPRFGVLLVAMLLSIAFIIVDICSVTTQFSHILPDGLNPFWKLAFVFKCLTDSIVLDDFKTALDRLMRYKMQRERLGTVDAPYGPTSEPPASPLWPDVGDGAALTKSFDSQNSSKGRDPLSEDALEDEDARMTGVRKARQKEQQATGGAGGGLTNPPGVTMRGDANAISQHVENWEDIDLPTFLAQERGRNDFAEYNEKG